jgi:hypothetical protein
MVTLQNHRTVGRKSTVPEQDASQQKAPLRRGLGPVERLRDVPEIEDPQPRPGSRVGSLVEFTSEPVRAVNSKRLFKTSCSVVRGHADNVYQQNGSHLL